MKLTIHPAIAQSVCLFLVPRGFNLPGVYPDPVGGLLLLANWPWTIFGIMPTNRVLMTTQAEEAGPYSRTLIVKWNRLHSVRTVLGGFAILAFLIALLSN